MVRLIEITRIIIITNKLNSECQLNFAITNKPLSLLILNNVGSIVKIDFAMKKYII